MRTYVRMVAGQRCAEKFSPLPADYQIDHVLIDPYRRG